MQYSLKFTGAIALTLALAGCFDGSNKSRAPAMVKTVDFTEFVVMEVENSADDRNAVDINNLEFSFDDQENAQAFNALF